MVDSNPSSTEYQIKVGTNYISHTGTLTAAPEWVTFGNKRLTLTGLTPGTTYSFSAKARNHTGTETAFSTQVNGTTLALPPDTPVNITTQITKDAVTVSWGEMERATGYEIEVDGLIIDNGANTTYLHDGLEPLSGHTYRVRAKNRGGKSLWSAPIDVTTHPENPDMPTNLMGTSEENAVTIIWYKVPHAESYDIEMDGTVVTDITDTLYVHSGLDAGTQHTYRVRARNISGMSEWSSPLTMSTLPHIEDGDRNIALTNMVAIVTNDSITISWDAVAPDVEYDVEVDGTLKDNGTETIYKHTGLESNTFHRYRIKVKNSEGLSQWCGVLALSTLPDPPDAPQGIEAFAGSNAIELRWERIEGASGYDLEIDGQITDSGENTSYVHDGLEPGTSHTYRVRAKNITGVTAWSPAITVSTTNPTYTVQCTNDTTFELSLLASNVQDFIELKFIVTYNPDELDVVDLYNFTPGEDVITGGKIPGSDIYVTYTPGRIELAVDRSIVPGTSWSGEISAVLFNSKIDGETNINFTVE